MSKLATIAFGAAIVLAPALGFAQQTSTNPNNQKGTSSYRTQKGTPGQSSSSTSNNGTSNGQTTPGANNSTNSNGSADRTMPQTAAGWLGMLLSGSTLSGAGLWLRRLRKS